MGALISRRVDNLLAGALAAFAIEKRATPRAVRNTEKLRAEFQARLLAHGVEIAWPRITPR